MDETRDRLATTVLITGATGFIGRHLTGALLDAGHGVRALVRRPSPRADSLDRRVMRIDGALTDTAAWARAAEHADAIVYAAGATRGRQYRDFAAANVHGVRTMTDVLARTGREVPVLLLSSLAATEPGLSDYALSKRLGEQALPAGAYAWTVLRPPAVYGPGDVELAPLLRSIARGWAFIPGDGAQRVRLLHVHDLVRAVMAWMRGAEACFGSRFTIDDGRPGGYDWPAIVDAVGGARVRRVHLPRRCLAFAAVVNLAASAVTGTAPMLTPGKVRELTHPVWRTDNAPYREATGWQPEITLAAGARMLGTGGAPPEDN